MLRFLLLPIVCYLFSSTHGTPIWDGEDVGTLRRTRKTVEVFGQRNFPYIVNIDINASDENTDCGGVIISRRVVLTAAHCIEGKIQPIIIVRAGIVDLFHEKDSAQKRTVIDFHIHEKYKRLCQVGKKRCCHAVNDIALLWTEKYFEFGPTVKRASFSWNDKPIGKTGWILGWGDKKSGESPSMLQKGLVKVTSEQTCEKFNPTIYVTQTVMCLRAVSGDTMTGIGDSGGPFVINGVVYGIASYTFSDQCSSKALDVYTFVGKYYNWIMNNLSAGPPKNKLQIHQIQIMNHQTNVVDSNNYHSCGVLF